MRKAVLAAGAVAGALASIVGLLVMLWPDDPPAAHAEGEITAATLREPNMTRRDYCTRIFDGQARDCLAGGHPNDRGNLFVVRVSLRNYSDVCCRLEWSLYDAESKTAVRPFIDVPAAKDLGPVGTRDFRIWVPNPRTGRFFVTFDLYDENGHIADASSRPYSTVARGL